MKALAARLKWSIVALLVACANGSAPSDSSSTYDDQTDPGGDQSQPADPPQTPDRGHVSDAGAASDAAPAQTDAAMDDSAAADADAGPVTCQKTLTIPQVSLSNAVCTDINTQVIKGPATLTYPCAGGAATATFGTQTFTGTVTGTHIQITNVQKFNLGPCQLQSSQMISGDLSAPPLLFGYGETFLSGDCSGDIICKAQGNVSVN